MDKTGVPTTKPETVVEVPVYYQPVPSCQAAYGSQDFWSTRFPFYRKPRVYSPDNHLDREHKISFKKRRKNKSPCSIQKQILYPILSTKENEVLKEPIVKETTEQEEAYISQKTEISNNTTACNNNINSMSSSSTDVNIISNTSKEIAYLEKFNQSNELIQEFNQSNEHIEEFNQSNEHIIIVHPSDYFAGNGNSSTSKEENNNSIPQSIKSENLNTNGFIEKGKRQYSCKYCDKGYMTLSALKMHIRTHTLPCKCDICGKAFSRQWLLQGHIRTHTGERPYACSYCTRAFADRSNLRAHMQTHISGQGLECRSCFKVFTRAPLLLKHVEQGCEGRKI